MTGQLLNDYGWGGYLIWEYPGRPLFIDAVCRSAVRRPFLSGGVRRVYQTDDKIEAKLDHMISSWS